MKICLVEECERKSRSRGLCSMHWHRWYRHGDVELQKVFTKSLAEALSLRAHWEGECYVWSGCKTEDGYAIYAGHESYEHGTRFLHRIMWERERGQIPKGLEIDHLCHTRNCLNTAHMRVGDRVLNMSNLSGKRKNPSSSGRRGVYPNPNGNGKYIGVVVYRNKRYYLGVHETVEEASSAVEAKRSELHSDLAA